MIQDGQNGGEGAPLRDGLPVQAPSPSGLGHSAGIPSAAMRFGKYKGLLIADIITFNPQYLLWADQNLDTFSLSDDQKTAARKAFRERERASMERQNAWAWGFGGGAKKAREAQVWKDIKAEQAVRAKRRSAQ